MISIKNIHWEKCPIEKNWCRYPIYTCVNNKRTPFPDCAATIAVDYNIGIFIITVDIRGKETIVNLPIEHYDLSSILVAAHELIECLITDYFHDNIGLYC